MHRAIALSGYMPSSSGGTEVAKSTVAAPPSVDLRRSKTMVMTRAAELARMMLQTTPHRPKNLVAGMPTTKVMALAAQLAMNMDRGDSIARSTMEAPTLAAQTTVSMAKKGR